MIKVVFLIVETARDLLRGVGGKIRPTAMRMLMNE